MAPEASLRAIAYVCAAHRLEGELHTELEDGRKFMLSPGMSYQVGDHAEAHRSSTATGAKLFIVD
jgi:hypothetical protein